jgi:signal peptidase I
VERNWRVEARDWIRTLLLTALLSLGLRVAVVEAFVVPTGSMRPTIQEGDRLLGSKFHYWFWAPKRGELVVFRPPPAAQEITQAEASRYVKRVIATAGDVVEVRDRRVRVNGRQLDEPYLEAPPRYDMPPTRVPEGQLFTPEQLAAMETVLPERLDMPNGRKSRLTYHKEGPPVIAARIQELFGIAKNITLGRGRVPVKIEVLAPNQRPIQVTDDLERFWRETYPEIKPALSRRYPRHEWR